MSKRIVRRLMMTVVAGLWALPGSGCLPADEIHRTLAGLLQGEPNTPGYVYDAGWP